MKLENLKTFNFEGAFRGMRNPMNSWNKSDSIFTNDKTILGENDLRLARRLIRVGGEHRKFLRQIFISFDLTAPLYFWKEFDTYKIGTTANSTSTMHKLASTPITEECFELENLDMVISSGKNIDGEYEFCFYDYFEDVMIACEELRVRYNHTKDKRYWKALIQLLPESWLQTRTITMNYENVFNIIHQRSNHKLSEWNWLVEEFKQLPYSYELLYSHINTEEVNEN